MRIIPVLHSIVELVMHIFLMYGMFRRGVGIGITYQFLSAMQLVNSKISA